MLFSSTIFVFAFLPCVVLLYYILDPRYRNYLLLFASLIFYAWGEPKFVFVMLVSIAINYICGLLIHKKKKSNNKKYARLCLVICISLNLLILFVFKYLNFFTHNLSLVFPDNVRETAIKLPIGISFFTFQALSYVIDVYRGRAEVQKNPLYVGLYISFFPQLIAGPIVRYGTVAKEIANRKITLEDFSYGVKRFIQGFSKKIILSNAFAVVADRAFSLAGTADLSVSFAWIGALSYTLQIYFDFSGYSDMAIGLGRMFGFHFQENFDYPYISDSISEFWRRWHISLGGWFRDYLYIPLGGSRVKSGRLILNLFIVWFLTGLWHGASWHFVAWGLMYFVLITIEKLTGLPKKLSSNTAGKALCRVFTLLMVMVGWVLFRSESCLKAGQYISVMFGFSGNAWTDPSFIWYTCENAVLLVIGCVASTPVFKMLGKKLDSIRTGTKLVDLASAGWHMLLFYISVSYLVLNGHNPFIYFNF